MEVSSPELRKIKRGVAHLGRENQKFQFGPVEHESSVTHVVRRRWQVDTGGRNSEERPGLEEHIWELWDWPHIGGLGYKFWVRPSWLEEFVLLTLILPCSLQLLTSAWHLHNIFQSPGVYFLNWPLVPSSRSRNANIFPLCTTSSLPKTGEDVNSNCHFLCVKGFVLNYACVKGKKVCVCMYTHMYMYRCHIEMFAVKMYIISRWMRGYWKQYKESMTRRLIMASPHPIGWKKGRLDQSAARPGLERLLSRCSSHTVVLPRKTCSSGHQKGLWLSCVKSSHLNRHACCLFWHFC